MKSDIEQMAADLAAARKAGGVKVMYPKELKRRVVNLYRRQGGGSHSRFAEALGISPTAVTKWLRGDEPKAAAMVPVRVAKIADSAFRADLPAHGGVIALCFRGVTIQLPLSTPPAQVARLAAALAEVTAC